MNRVVLKGFLRNIQPSHKVGDIEYNKADILVRRANGKEDLLNIRFKKFSNPYKEDQEVELVGNIRSYSKQISINKNKVDIYVFSYFDKPEESEENISNKVILDGRICIIDNIRTTKDDKQNIHFIIANNLSIDNDSKKLNSYIPCIAWGKVAKEVSKLSINSKVKVVGELHSREYKKYTSTDEYEIRVAYELLVTEIEVVKEKE